LGKGFPQPLDALALPAAGGGAYRGFGGTYRTKAAKPVFPVAVSPVKDVLT